jgi:amino acid transporter
MPVAGVLLTAAGMAAFALIGQLETVALVFNLFIFAVFLLINLAVVGLRRR